jgi:hypothetical protein
LFGSACRERVLIILFEVASEFLYHLSRVVII